MFVLVIALRIFVGCTRGVIVKAMYCGIVVSSNSSPAIMFTFGQIPIGKGMNPLILPTMG